MKETEISDINKKITMKHNTIFVYFNITYGAGLICFLFLYYLNIENIFVTNFIIIMSITLLIVKLLYWYSIRNTYRDINNIDKQKSFLYRSAYCIFAYIIPVYCIIQEPNLVVSHYVSVITFTVITVLAIIGIFIERWLFIIESQQNNTNAN